MATQPPIPTNRRWRRRAVLNLGHLDFDIVSTARCPAEDLELRISDFASLGIFTLVESALQIRPFMQNKANFQKSQMNVTSFITRYYENNSNWTLGENKPNSKPIAERVKLMQSAYLQRIMKKNAAKGYEKTNPKQTQFAGCSNEHKLCFNKGL